MLVPYVITSACVDVKDTSCLQVCPVDCIYTHPDERQYFIHPEECIDCGSCEMVCPVSAIYRITDLPDSESHCAELNQQFFKEHTDFRDHHQQSWQ